jgi:hypothetical protein
MQTSVQNPFYRANGQKVNWEEFTYESKMLDLFAKKEDARSNIESTNYMWIFFADPSRERDNEINERGPGTENG